jgi:polyisoprenoid-binding protein YceI
MDMIKYVALPAAALLLAFAIPRKPVATTGSWQIDEHRSSAQLSADGTTNFGKAPLTMTIGLTRVEGSVKLDGSNPANSAFDFHLYPASTMTPPIGEDGRINVKWIASQANTTLVCFHSKGTQQTADGRLQTTGQLSFTRVDHNVEVVANEAYAGPVYGPAMIHQVARTATFVFDVPAAVAGKEGIRTSGTTTVVREDFPQMLKAVIGTYWPPLVMDQNCTAPAANEGYAGARCTGTFLVPPTLPGPAGNAGEDYPGPSGYNTVTGEHLTIVVNMRLNPGHSGAKAAAGN